MPLSAADEENAFRIQLEVLPEDARVHARFADFLAGQGRDAEAIAHYKRAIALDARGAAAHHRLAMLLARGRRYEEAIPHLEAALAANPADVYVLTDLGNTLVNARRPARALPVLREAAALAPSQHAAHINLALALTELGRFAEAEAAFMTALRLAPAHAPVHNNLATLYIMMGRHHEAIGELDLALALDPGYAAARRNRALAHLALGDFAAGWKEYDWCAAGMPPPPPPARARPWNGEPFARRRLLLTARQGLGDMLQFIRYAPLLKALPDPPSEILLECPIPLLDVLAHAPGVDAVLPLDQPRELSPDDFYTALMALPRHFNTTVETIPGGAAYLQADPRRVAFWRERLAPLRATGKRLIGLAWQGNPHHQWDQFRSLPLQRLEPIIRLPEVCCISLQRGPGVEQIGRFNDLQRVGNAASPAEVFAPTDGRQDSPEALADTAAILMLLDLVIGVDSAVAHLAGALGRPVWVMLSQAADWRWLSGRADTPWYPTMRLFRQETIHDWRSVVEDIVRALT